MILPLSMPGPWEMFLIVFVVLLLFGGKRLPELAKGLGKGIREFKAAMSDATDDVKREIENAGQKKEEPKQ